MIFGFRLGRPRGPSGPKKSYFRFHVVGIVPRKPNEVAPMLEITCDVASKARVQIKPTSLSGGPATIEPGSPTVAPADNVLNPFVAMESADTFTVQCDLPDGETIADADFVVSGDADLGAGVKTISDVVRLHLTTEQAANLGLTSVEVVPR